MKECRQEMSNAGTNALVVSRDERIDSIKFCLILLVIAGHVFSNKIFSNYSACGVIWHWIYMFHMPLFVFISGYFSHKKNDTSSFLKNIIKIFEPLVIVQIIMIAIKFISTKQIQISDVLTPWWVMWYLLSLIYWRTLLHVLPNRVLCCKKVIIAGSFIVGIIGGFLPFDRFLSIQRTLALMPFFFLGYYMHGKKLYLPSKSKIYCFIFLCLVFIVPLYFPQYLGDLRFADRYADISSMFSRIFVYCLSICMSISFMTVCPNTVFLSKQGKYTLQYYIYHALILYVLLIMVRKFGLPTSIIAAFGYTILVTLIIWLFSHFSFFTKLTKPFSCLKKTK